MKDLKNWARLAGAAADARDDLRNLLPRLERAIATADAGMLTTIRDLAIRHSGAITLALKHPTYQTTRPTPRRDPEPPASRYRTVYKRTTFPPHQAANE